MALPDLTEENIQDTFQRVLQKHSDGYIYDGTGSLFTPPNSLVAQQAKSINVADNESKNENNLITFIQNEDATGYVSLESDGDFHYNPSTGKVTATQFDGLIDGGTF